MSTVRRSVEIIASSPSHSDGLLSRYPPGLNTRPRQSSTQAAKSRRALNWY
jgi:hypothetical protein